MYQTRPRSALDFRPLAVSFLCLFFLITPAASAAPPRGHLLAELLLLPAAERCERRVLWVPTLYRVVRHNTARALPKEPPAVGQQFIVFHACPEKPRGFSRHGRGDAPKLRPGQRHWLSLRTMLAPPRRISELELGKAPLAESTLPKYLATRTDRAAAIPLIIVRLHGRDGSNRRLQFGGERIDVGSAIHCDVQLRSKTVAPVQLALQVVGDHLKLIPLAKSPAITINGKPITRPTAITYRDRIACDGFNLKAALLHDPGGVSSPK